MAPNEEFQAISHTGIRGQCTCEKAPGNTEENKAWSNEPKENAAAANQCKTNKLTPNAMCEVTKDYEKEQGELQEVYPMHKLSHNTVEVNDRGRIITLFGFSTNRNRTDTTLG
ncbi:hypothetical protein Hypma_004845 [Hypsizygus marmoreus]|uniref:Uncharacterized protein n=1 Tax=Hypsizygus marmoreus TaxID=39966 RepID=A0A369J4C2_HYPMA|nr:hypothetical protein Hypma_004845 [Hypsizygus marmoreus]